MFSGSDLVTEGGSGKRPDVAVDNDVLIKAASYGLIDEFWPEEPIGILGAARYVVASGLARMDLARDRAAAQNAAAARIDSATVLEPTGDELLLATQIETTAQRKGLSLDAGESQLAAIILHRSISLLDTGDKRAIRGFETLMNELAELAGLHGRLRSLEQIVVRCADAGDPGVLAQAICSEPRVDKTLSICFRCFSPPPHGSVLDRAGLESYIRALREAAPRVLCCDPQPSGPHEDGVGLDEAGD